MRQRSPLVEPVEPFESVVLDSVRRALGRAAVNQIVLVNLTGGLGQGTGFVVHMDAHQGLDPDLSKALGNT